MSYANSVSEDYGRWRKTRRHADTPPDLPKKVYTDMKCEDCGYTCILVHYGNVPKHKCSQCGGEMREQK